MRLLLDTHIWLWSHLEPERLARRVSSALTATDNEIWVSPISVWELLLLVEKRRVVVKGDPLEWIDAAWSSAATNEAALNREVARRSRSVRVPHQEPADRFLAATAEVFDLTLVTDDERLLRGKGHRTLANRWRGPRRCPRPMLGSPLGCAAEHPVSGLDDAPGGFAA